VLHADAWTHLPPWQFVEQHCAPDAQAFPSVVQVEPPDGTGIVAHRPPLQRPEQHWEPLVQLAEVERHAPDAQVPFAQVRLQQSALRVQLAPVALQNSVELHLCVVVSHAVEQQSAFDAQFSPPGLQASDAGAPHVPFAWHLPEQHWLSAVHVAAATRHWFAGVTHTLFAHAFEQQFELSPQISPTSLHCAASTHVPVQALEQHSEGNVQLLPACLHAPPSGVSCPPSAVFCPSPEDCLLQAARPTAMESARMRWRVDERIVVVKGTQCPTVKGRAAERHLTRPVMWAARGTGNDSPSAARTPPSPHAPRPTPPEVS
jgi:hypothetical protein